jgi:hypothetical protein
VYQLKEQLANTDSQVKVMGITSWGLGSKSFADQRQQVNFIVEQYILGPVLNA